MDKQKIADLLQHAKAEMDLALNFFCRDKLDSAHDALIEARYQCTVAKQEIDTIRKDR